MEIRDATAADLETIVEFNCRLAAETEDKALDRELLRPGVAAVLDDPRKGRYLVACQDGEVIGQLMHTFEWSDWRNGDIWWLQSVYVHQQHRRGGVFRRLLETLVNGAEADPGVVGLRLYVEHENATAQATYRKLGFVGDEYQVMERLFVSITPTAKDTHE